jgi:hypothetical protein
MRSGAMSSFNTKLASVGARNTEWGICGFTSSLYAMYHLNRGSRGQVINASEGYRILAEIKIYLLMLKSMNSPLLGDIRDYTRSFGPPYDTFEIDSYIERITKAAASNLDLKTILADELYSIAMPPQAVADYIQRVWGWNATVAETAQGNGTGDGIYGVSYAETDDKGAPKPYHGVGHYLYSQHGKIYSWGDCYTSVQDAANQGAGGVPWRVYYVISVSRA